MSSSDQRKQLAERIISSDEFAETLWTSNIADRISFQLRAMQGDRGWTQQDIAKHAGIAQPLISKYLSGYDKYSLETLKRLARAFDVTLVVGFAPYGDLVDWLTNLTAAKLAVPPRVEDPRLLEMVSSRTEPRDRVQWPGVRLADTSAQFTESATRAAVVSISDYRRPGPTFSVDDVSAPMAAGLGG